MTDPMNAIDPRDRRTPDLSPAELARREKQRIARANREAPASYAARILRELDALEELSEELNR